MSETPESQLQGNRFEAMYQRWRQRSTGRRRWLRWLGGGVLFLVTAEILALGFVFAWYANTGKLGYTYVDKFLLTRWTVAPFVSGNPARGLPGITYIGTNTSHCMGTRWLQPDSLLGWRLRPGSSYLKQPNQIFDKVGWRMSNPQGFAAAGSIDFHVERQKPANTFRILILGASSVEGDGAESPLDNLPSNLKAELTRRALPDGKAIEVINGGVGGYRVMQEFLYLQSELMAYQPDLIISYSGFVDLAYARIEQDQTAQAMEPFRTARHRRNSYQLDQGQTVSGSFAQFSAILSFQARCLVDDLALTFLIGKLAERTGFAAESTAKRTSAADPEVLAAAVSAYEEGIASIRDLSRRKGVKLAVGLQPSLGVGDKPLTAIEREMLAGLGPRERELRRAYHERATALLNRLASEGDGFCVIDLASAFAGLETRVWEDSRHLLGTGNTAVASKLLDGVSRCGLLDSIAK